MAMEEKIVINELEQGRELTKRLINNLKHTSSTESSKVMISEILRIYQNAILMLSFKQDDKNILKRSREIEDKGSKNVSKKRKESDKKTEDVKVFVGKGQEIDDGYCWRKYGQKEIHGSSNPRGYFRCTNRFTQKCLAVKQVQRSDKDPSIFEVKYVGNHTCNNNSTSPKTTAASFSVSMLEEGSRVGLREQREDTKKPKRIEQVMISLEDVEYKKGIFKTYSFSNHEIEDGGGWKSNIFQENLSPATTTTSGSGMTSEIVTAPAAVEDWGDVDSYFSSLDNIIDLGQDLWS
ncbi:putative WRKY transcription factor 46 [Raphanus sativus]|uniref:Probable WRKY transcription factor 46 n=1 Tax=Raphanus sativus TaxID=3726 RepID=A0A6J0LRH0_RAPSA|nr:probable WRKY transcription factor 46 [Raphanus sativus]KAJ4906196.1 putative WRKY transcription factor 46 [Raphanus sativus]